MNENKNNLTVQRFVCNMIRENSYVVSDATKECIIVDCGAFYPEEQKAIVDYIKSNELKPKHLISTHGHFDHNLGDEVIFRHFDLNPEMSADDVELYNHLPEQTEALAETHWEGQQPPVKTTLKGGDSISFGNHSFVVMETPGHTPGGLTFYCEAEHVAFTGDTLFRGSIGRTDLQGGSMFQMIQSLRMLAQLPDETLILPGHGETTTIGRELETNPYMDR